MDSTNTFTGQLVRHEEKLNRVAAWVGLPALHKVLAMWQSPERHYHNIQHMSDMFDEYDAAVLGQYNELEKDALLCGIVYHDAYYDPRMSAPYNEVKSRDIWEADIKNGPISSVEAVRVSNGFSEPRQSLMLSVSALIDATQDHSKEYSFELIKLFLKWDLSGLTSSDLTVLIDGERRVLKEYQFHDYEKYREGRIAILEKFKPFILTINPDSKIESLIQYVKARKLKIGIYAGSFNPMHAGHYSIIKRAEKVFDKVIIACGNNPVKQSGMTGRTAEVLMTETLPYHQIDFFDGLLTQYVQSKRTKYVEPTVIKGLGRSGDYEEEKMQMRYMEDMDPTINMSFFISDRRFDYVSSTGARIVKEIQPEIYSKYALGQWPDAEEKMKS